MYFKKYRDSQGYWRWTYYAGNHEPIAVASEAYVRELDCDHSIALVKGSSNAPVYRV